MSPQQARGLAEYLLTDFQQELPTTIRVIEAAPADKLDYAPDPKSQTGLALIRHLVNVDIWFLNAIADGKFGGGDGTEPPALNTPAEAAAAYNKGIPAAIARVRGLSDEKLAAELDFFGRAQFPTVVLIGVALKHSIHHRGQLSSYLRAMGGKVPDIYGPSGDSEATM